MRERGKPERPSGRWLLWSALIFLVAGISCLAFVGWQIFGTTVVAHHRQQQIVKQVERRWAQTPRGPGTSATALPRGVTALVRIPRFGPKYVVPVLEGTDDYELSRGLGHYDHTAAAGQVGNYAIAGHRITHGEPLRDMPSLRPGDAVVVETASHVYTYELDTDPNALVLDFRQGWVLDSAPQNPASGGVQPPAVRQVLTLTTCADLFHTDERLVAFGHLAKEQTR